MNIEKLRKDWEAEERSAHIHGWDFSHLRGRYDEENDLPWSYEEIVKKYLNNEKNILDIDTGGGEFLLSLGHPYNKTSATEGYKPNVQLCSEKLLPLGIDFKEASDYKNLPFEDESFDIVINRHGDFNAHEIYRILKPHGLFITEQVGSENDRGLVEMVLPGLKAPFPDLTLDNTERAFDEEGFEIIEGEEAFRPIKFYDVGALVWFARIIQWEFPGFSVDKCFDRLLKVQEILDRDKVIEAEIHRFLLVAMKK